MTKILTEIKSRFAAALSGFDEPTESFLDMIRPAQDPRFGDFQANCAMPLAKKLGRNPRDVATDIVEQLDVADLCEAPEVAGPGFINLKLRDDRIESAANLAVKDDRLGVVPAATPRQYVVDYSSPNVAKPMHVGHLRSTVIGDAIYRVLQHLGHQVIGDNHIGDWGTQFGMIIFGYRHFLDESNFDSDPVGELARLYRLVNQLSEYQETVRTLPATRESFAQRQADLEQAEQAAAPNDKAAKKALKRLRADVDGLRSQISAMTSRVDAVEQDPRLVEFANADPDIADAARGETAKLHAGDPDNTELWRRFLPLCTAALDEMYDRLRVRFDETLGESFYQPQLQAVVDALQESGIASESEGAVCVFSEGNDAPFIVQKSDGAFTYATTDLATIRHRLDEFKADGMLYVVDKRQSEHFNLLFDTARRCGWDQAEYRHVSFGTILGNDGKPYKTRSGDTVGLGGLLDEAIERAAKIVAANDDAKKNGPELDAEERQRIAQIVGIGGIKYVDLHHNRDSDYKFSWDKMLATTGDTAAYAQYAYARICGIFRRGEIDREALRAGETRIRFTCPAERSLALQLVRFPETLDDVIDDFRPNLLTSYLFETGNAFSTFYSDENCHVLNEENEQLRGSRLLLCDLTARVLRTGLELLGIETAERM